MLTLLLNSIALVILIGLVYLPTNSPPRAENIRTVLEYNICTRGRGIGLRLKEKGYLKDPNFLRPLYLNWHDANQLGRHHIFVRRRASIAFESSPFKRLSKLTKSAQRFLPHRLEASQFLKFLPYCCYKIKTNAEMTKEV